METVFEIKHLQKSFGDNVVLKDISFNVAKGEILSIIGSSGSGKSTLLRCINLLETPDGGSISYHGEDILSPRFELARYRAKVGMVFQQFNLFNNMSVLENCMIGRMKILGASKEEARSVAMENLSKVGMEAFAGMRPGRISGGQKQRAAIASLLYTSPRTRDARASRMPSST